MLTGDYAAGGDAFTGRHLYVLNERMHFYNAAVAEPSVIDSGTKANEAGFCRCRQGLWIRDLWAIATPSPIQIEQAPFPALTCGPEVASAITPGSS